MINEAVQFYGCMNYSLTQELRNLFFVVNEEAKNYLHTI